MRGGHVREGGREGRGSCDASAGVGGKENTLTSLPLHPLLVFPSSFSVTSTPPLLSHPHIIHAILLFVSRFPSPALDYTLFTLPCPSDMLLSPSVLPSQLLPLNIPALASYTQPTSSSPVFPFLLHDLHASVPALFIPRVFSEPSPPSGPHQAGPS